MNRTILRQYFLAVALSVIAASFGLCSQAVAKPTAYEIAEDEFAKADEKLKAAYEDTLKAISRLVTRDNFIKAHQSWLAFRDAEAEFQTSIGNKGGIVYAHGHLVVATKLTNDRIQHLKRFKKEIERSRVQEQSKIDDELRRAEQNGVE